MPEQTNQATEVAVETTETTEQVVDNNVETVETTETTETNAETSTEETKPSFLDEFEYQFDKKSTKVSSMEELKELAEMGRYYKEKGKENVEFVKAQAKKYNMTPSDYRQAVAEQERLGAIQEIAQKENVDEAIAEKLYKAEQIQKKDDERNMTTKQKADAQALMDKRIDEFADKYPEVKTSEDMPEEVWKEFLKGEESLINLYKDHENSLLKGKLAKYEEQENTQNRNAENAEAATGSVTGNGSTTDAYFTQAQVKSMSQDEVKKNLSAIENSMKRWK